MKKPKDSQIVSVLALVQELAEQGYEHKIFPIVRDGKLMSVDVTVDIDMVNEGAYNISSPVVSDTESSAVVHVFYNDRDGETQACLTWTWSFGMYIPAEDEGYVHVRNYYEEEEIAVEN